MTTVTVQRDAVFLIMKTLKISVSFGQQSVGVDKPLVHGQSYFVDVVHQTSPGATTSDQRIAFLIARQAVFAGAQGIWEVSKQCWQELPKGFGYESFCKNGAAMNVLPYIYCYVPRKSERVTYGFGQVSSQNEEGYDFSSTEHDRPHYCLDGFLCFRESPVHVISRSSTTVN